MELLRTYPSKTFDRNSIENEKLLRDYLKSCGFIYVNPLVVNNDTISIEFNAGYIGRVYSKCEEIGEENIVGEVLIATKEELFDALKYCWNPAILDFFPVDKDMCQMQNSISFDKMD